MNILPYTIANTNDLLTSRGGLVCLAALMRRIGFSAWVERYFPKPGSHRGYAPAEVVTLWMLMLHEGARSLEDVRYIREDKALRKLPGLRRLPCGQFEANALYFHLCVTAYNLFVLFRRSLPPEWRTCRVITIRWRLYALAAKVVCHARRVYVKCRPDQARPVTSLLAALAPPERPPPLTGAA